MKAIPQCFLSPGMFGARLRTPGWVPIQQVELKSERLAVAYRLLLAYAFVLPGSSKIAHTRIRNIGPTTISFCRFTTALSSSVAMPSRRHSRHRPGEAAAGQGHRHWTRRPTTRPASSSPSTSGSATASCSASGRAPRSRSDGVEYLIMKESDIMGMLVEVEAKKKAA